MYFPTKAGFQALGHTFRPKDEYDESYATYIEKDAREKVVKYPAMLDEMVMRSLGQALVGNDGD